MATNQLRPLVSELVFHLYDQPLHPELFDVQLARTVRHADYSLTVRITRTGHAISWDSPRGHLTELAATPDVPLPSSRSLVQKKMRGEHTTSIPWAPGLNYQFSFQVETLPAEVFVHVHDEIMQDGLKRGLLHNFRPGNRLALAPLGHVTTEAWAGNLVVSAFHTFPDESTIVKTQSLIERRA
ncbi:MAG: DUF2617 family protein [Gemmataceae bacterium]